MTNKARVRTFEGWCQQVDRYVVGLAGLSKDDLPDCPYRDWYDDGVPALTAAKRAIRLAQEN